MSRRRHATTQSLPDPDFVVSAFAEGTPARKALRVLRPHRRHLGIAAVAFAFKHSPVWMMPFVTAAVIDVVVDHSPLSKLVWVGAITLAILGQNYPVTLL